MKLHLINGKKTAVINIFIDPENGFSNLAMTEAQGGVLYVPGGEQVMGKMADIIKGTRGGIFILGQDYHPANHISFMVNHKGVMEYRMEKFSRFLAEQGQPQPDTREALFAACQQPVHFFNGFDNPPVPFPFEEIVLDENRNIIGLKEEDGRIRKVTIETSSGMAPSEKDRGRVTSVLDGYLDHTFDDMRAAGRLLSTQTLWTKHCVQGTESALFHKDMDLPAGLEEKLKSDLMSKSIFFHDAATDNTYYVIRKGDDPELDSYGIGVENDGDTQTAAWDVFRQLSRQLKSAGCESVIINIGGLATNFCVEFSANNVADFLAGFFKMKNMTTDINLVPEICRGIPIPGGADVPFSLAGTAERLRVSRNIQEASVDDVLAMGAPEARITGKKRTMKFPK